MSSRSLDTRPQRTLSSFVVRCTSFSKRPHESFVTLSVFKLFWNKKIKQKCVKAHLKRHRNISQTNFSAYPRIIPALAQRQETQSMDNEDTVHESDLKPIT